MIVEGKELLKYNVQFCFKVSLLDTNDSQSNLGTKQDSSGM